MVRGQQARLGEVEHRLGLLRADAARIDECGAAARARARQLRKEAKNVVALGREDLALLALDRHRRAIAELDVLSRQLQDAGDAIARCVAALEAAAESVAAMLARAPDRVAAAERLLGATLSELPLWLAVKQPAPVEHAEERNGSVRAAQDQTGD
jgi:phage shock protein A